MFQELLHELSHLLPSLGGELGSRPYRTYALGVTNSELGYEIIKILPHDSQIYTQGLILDQNHFYESSGQYGKSFLRKYTSDEFVISKEIKIASNLFAEGITILEDKLFMLTWKSNKGLVFDKNTLALLDTFEYSTEGWGLTNNAVSYTHLTLPTKA